MKQLILSFYILILSLPLAIAAPTEIKDVKVVRVVDGDTAIMELPKVGNQSIRIWGIDALEKKQAYGPQCTEFLHSLIDGKPVMLRIHNKDQYGRLVAQIYQDGKDVGLTMVRYGYAFHASYMNKDKALKQAQIDAKKQRLGMWALDKEPMPPWTYRKTFKWQ